jgi:amino acid adenylation domain-containing protein
MIALTQQSPKRAYKPEWEEMPGVWNRTAEDFPAETCLHELFEARVAATPDAEALVVGAVRITYRELNVRANRVAHRLRSLGVMPETLVGIFLDRSADMVIAILGVLKAGGAYVPLDPAYPPERLAFMLDDSQVGTILTQSSLMGNLRGFQIAGGRIPRMVCIDSDRRIALASAENPDPSAQARNLAYVIYTSGSTGRPKGVALEHRNAVALLHWAGQTYSVRELNGVLASTSISFDPSILDILMPLSLGGKIILAPHALALPNLAAAAEVRMVTMVPSAMRELLRIGGLPVSLETINLGGEPLSTQLVDQLYALPHVKRVFDLYGPTETATCSTFALRIPQGPATIGRPIAHTQVCLLDEHFRPVPAGETGELFIGGAGIARGYINRPEATAEKFIQLPFAADRQARFYRTGDRCRRLPDGNLEFVGRLDRQVKIRGFRVELGEIETALLMNPAVDETLVIAHEDAPGEKRLVAYVVPRATPTREKPETPAAAESRIVPQLRSHLKDRLPGYMLPSSIVLLGRFELTSNGKIDHASLPAPERTRAGAGDCLAPRTPTEELLCEIWAGLLGVKEIGVHDDFYQLGGDSLLSVAMLAEVERETGLRLPIEAMLQVPSVSRLAAFLDERRRSRCPASDSPCVEIQPRGSRPRLFLVHGVGGGMLWGYANLARYLGSDQPIYAFKACGPERLGEFDTIEKIAVHYVRALRQLQPEGPYALGGYCFGGNVAYEMARLLEQQGQQVSLLALMNSSPPNSSYYRARWTPVHLYKFLRNLGHWVEGVIQWNRAKRRRFLRWKMQSAKKRAMRWLRPASGRSAVCDVGELLDLSAVPDDQRSLWESHVRSFDNHQTHSYGGKVVLFRTRGHPLLGCSYDERCGWGELALGGITVRLLPGLHESLLEEPHVRAVARELKAELDAIQPNAGKLS